MYLSKLTCCFIALLVIHLAEAGFYSRSHSKENGQSQWGKPQVGTANIANATKNQKSTQRADTGKFDAKNGKTSALSAWGIIGIILGVIMLSTVTYYGFILYPYLCRQQRSYDMMELSNIV